MEAIGLFLDSKSSDPFIFYPGWDVVHADWTPLQYTRDEWRSSDWGTFTLYFTLWANVVLSLAIFGLFGFTPEALDVYKRGLSKVSRRLGRTPSASQNPTTSELVFRGGHTESGTEFVYEVDLPACSGIQTDAIDRGDAGDFDMHAYKRAEAGELREVGVKRGDPVMMEIKTQ